MRDLLGPRQDRVLAGLAAARTLVALDFDGTLAPIVADRDAAAMRAPTARLLAALAERYPCAVVSGRGRRDVATRVGGARLRALVGNHGLEPGPRDRLAAAAAVTRRASALLAAVLADRRGIAIEDKRYSLAVHHRGVGDRAARAAIVAAVAALPLPMRVVLGHAVVNVVPAHAPHKGDAVRALRDRLGAERVLFVGDDVTDEDVFAIDGPDADWLVAVRVGRSRRSAAGYFVRDQRAIDRLLRALIARRPAPARRAR